MRKRGQPSWEPVFPRTSLDDFFLDLSLTQRSETNLIHNCSTFFTRLKFLYWKSNWNWGCKHIFEYNCFHERLRVYQIILEQLLFLPDEAQVQLAEAQEKERVATEHALELNSRLTAVESQLVTYRQDKSRLEATLEMERTRLETAEEARSRYKYYWEDCKWSVIW